MTSIFLPFRLLSTVPGISVFATAPPVQPERLTGELIMRSRGKKNIRKAVDAVVLDPLMVSQPCGLTYQLPDVKL